MSEPATTTLPPLPGSPGASMPAITPAMIATLVLDLVMSGLIMFNLNLDAEHKGALATIINTLAFLGFLAHEAYVRGKRVTALAEIHSAQINAAAPPIFLPAPDPAPVVGTSGAIVAPKRSRIPKPAPGK